MYPLSLSGVYRWRNAGFFLFHFALLSSLDVLMLCSILWFFQLYKFKRSICGKETEFHVAKYPPSRTDQGSGNNYGHGQHVQVY